VSEKKKKKKEKSIKMQRKRRTIRGEAAGGDVRGGASLWASFN
jgi:hypothetical protein